jgi:hypothetical protein
LQLAATGIPHFARPELSQLLTEVLGAVDDNDAELALQQQLRLPAVAFDKFEGEGRALPQTRCIDKFEGEGRALPQTRCNI